MLKISKSLASTFSSDEEDFDENTSRLLPHNVVAATVSSLKDVDNEASLRRRIATLEKEKEALLKAIEEERTARNNSDLLLTAIVRNIGKATKRMKKCDEIALSSFRNEFSQMLDTLQQGFNALADRYWTELCDGRYAIKHAVLNSSVR